MTVLDNDKFVRMRANDLYKYIKSLRQVFPLLLNKRKPYEPVIKKMMEFGSEENIPPAKEVRESIGFNSTKFRKALKEIYADVIDLISETQHIIDGRNPTISLLLFSKMKDVKTGKIVDNMFSLSIKLDHIPQVGDRFKFEFLDPIFALGDFRVSWVEHQVNLDGVEVTVYLLDKYFEEQILKDKPYLAQLIDS